jgi:hypothetical protein
MGGYGVVGQVISVPVDVNNRVTTLPRQLDNDYSFNVHLKRFNSQRVRTCQDVLKRQQLNCGWSVFNTVFNINPGNQGSPVNFCFILVIGGGEVQVAEGVDSQKTNFIICLTLSTRFTQLFFSNFYDC